MYWAENWGGNSLAITNGLEIAVIFFMTIEDLALPYLVPGEIGYVSELNTHGTEEGEILSDERDGVGT
jgi:hypothetical protein